ncbi:MAG: shikimate dehydrogenase [Bacillota bacterium]
MREQAIAGLYGLVGYPVSHSLSPLMHNRAFNTLGLNCYYCLFEVTPHFFPQALAGIKALGIKGVNITIPYKQRVLEFLDIVDPTAAAIGAVNTVVSNGGRLIGYNTDGDGSLLSLKNDAGLDPLGLKFIIFGSGGACRAVALTLTLKGAGKIVIASRNQTQASEISNLINKVKAGIAKTVSLEGIDYIKELKTADIVINSTPIGMWPKIEDPPIINTSLLSRHSLVWDLVYNPVETRFLREAKEHGCRTLSGLGMLLYQGAEAFRLWTGYEAPIEAMRQELEKAIRGKC